MTNLESITNAMQRLEIEISRQQNYILKFGESNDAAEYDKEWENYKIDAQYNLEKWDKLKEIRNNIK